MSKKSNRMRDKVEELRAEADDILAEGCHRISLELAAMADKLADQRDRLDDCRYLGDRAAAK